MRVTGGALRGRRLASPPGGVRPTGDRVREALFARLGGLEGVRALDLYAGTGALGIEALSRGAEHVTFVDRSNRSLAVLRRNLAALDLTDRATVVRGEAVRRLGAWGRDPDPPAFDLVWIDPPYASGEIEAALAALARSGVLTAAAVVVVESAKRHPWPLQAGFEVVDRRRYGDTEIAQLVVTTAGGDAGAGDDPGPA